MISNFKYKKGQSTVEYAVLIIIIIAALIAIQSYIQRGVSGRLKSSADDIGDQFSPGNTNVIMATKTKNKVRELSNVNGQGVSESSIIGDEIVNTSMKSAIINSSYEYMGSDK